MGGETEQVGERAAPRRTGGGGQGGERDELDLMHERRGRGRARQLDAVRAMVAEEHPHLASVLTDEHLGEIWGNLHGIAVNADVEERLTRARTRLRARYGDAYNFISDARDELDRISDRYVGADDHFGLSVPMDGLLDPAILQIPDHNVDAEVKFRMQLWDTLRSQPLRLAVDLRGDKPTFTMYWASAPDRDGQPIGHEGGKITWATLMAEGRFYLPYAEHVEFGPAYRYLMRYHDELQGEIHHWSSEADWRAGKVSDHPIASRISFWIQWDQRPSTPSGRWFAEAQELTDQAHAALLEERVEEAAYLLTEAENKYIDAAKRVHDYEERTTKGTIRALKVLTVMKEAGKFAGGVLTGRGPLAAAQFGRAALAVGAGTGAMSFTQEVVGQGSAIAHGVQDSFDAQGALVRSGKDAVVATVATWTGLHATRWAHGALRPTFLKYPGVPDLVRRHTPELLGGALASPAATATDIALSAATGEGRVPGSIGELTSMMIEDITVGALMQVGLSPMLGRLDGSNVKLKPPRDDPYSHGPKGVMTLYHGTAEGNMGTLDAGIDPAKGSYPHDFGPGFYTTPDRVGGDTYARTRADQRTRAGQPDQRGAVAEVNVRVADLGRIVDLRPGGAHRAKWEAFLGEPSGVQGWTWGDMLARNVEMRATAFEMFLRKNGLADADTIFGPLGEAPATTGITGGATTQVSVRSPEVAAHLDKIGLLWSAPKPP